jgi:hypothetical protein
LLGQLKAHWLDSTVIINFKVPALIKLNFVHFKMAGQECYGRCKNFFYPCVKVNKRMYFNDGESKTVNNNSVALTVLTVITSDLCNIELYLNDFTSFLSHTQRQAIKFIQL